MSKDEPDNNEISDKSEEERRKKKFERLLELAKIREFNENMDFVYKAVLISIYGNWMITFLDNIDLTYNTEQQLYIIIEAMMTIVLLASLILYFINPERTMMAIHGLSVTAIFIIEMLIDQSQLRTFILYTIGIMLWLSIDNLPFLTNLIISRRIRAIHSS